MTHRVLALMFALVLAGWSDAWAQFPPPPGQTATQSSPFPPPPGQTAAQSSPFPPPPGQTATQSSPFPPPPGQTSTFSDPGGHSGAPPAGPSPFAVPGQAPPQGQHPCDGFMPLRAEAEKNASLIRAASDRKAPREEVCAAFQRFAASEAKMVKFLETNQKLCGVPPDAIKQVKANHAKTLDIRKRVCQPGASPGGPSLSDALGGPVVPDAPKPGRGTFDTLTGSPLVR
jgi:hypothetical protein